MSKRKPLPEMSLMVLPVVVLGKFVRLIDKDGEFLTGPIPLERVTEEADAELFKPMLWMMSAIKLENNYKFHKLKTRSETDAWQRKVNTLEKSFRLRSLVHRKIRKRNYTRNSHELYRTATWEEALDRMWHQWNNQRRNKTRTKWERWAASVDNNHNKKMRGRLERQGNCKTNSRNHSTSELPLRD